MESLFNQWNHGFLGIALLILCYFLKKRNWFFWICLIFGAILFVDEIYQVVTGDQYGGLIHWLYIKSGLYEVEWIRDFNIWLDKLFGKSNEK